MERRKHACGALVAWAVALIPCTFAQARYAGGTGTAADPYLIETAEHLRSVGVYRSDWHYDVHYKLVADIDLEKNPMEPIGTLAMRFMGDFDGNGKTISNLKIERSSGDHVGLFGYADAEFRNLGLRNVEVNAPNSKAVGALAGMLVGGKIERCYVKGGTISGGDHVGGLVGDGRASVHQCYTSCSVSGREWVGGLAGIHWLGGCVSQCYSTANVSGDFTVGGLLGVGTGATRDCYATGAVQGNLYVGGLVGSGGNDGVICNCYAAGRIQANWVVGGLTGGKTVCCSSFWDTQVTGPTSTPYGVGKTTDELRIGATFRGWGRGMAWTIDEGKDYPRLAWENRPGAPLETRAFPESRGQGAAQQPYLIRTAKELNAIGDFAGEWDKHYRLECDIDMTGLDEPIRIIGCRSAPFTGVFDGNGHSIANFEYSTIQSYAGLFGVTRGAVIRRLTLVNPRLEQGNQSWSHSVAPLIGRQEEGTVECCGVDGGSVSASCSVGGLVGYSHGGTMTRCYSTCKVDSWKEAQDIGGLLGKGQRCNINNCYTRGEVWGIKNLGGLIGWSDHGSVSHCYAAGRVDHGLNTGGLIGIALQTQATGCFWDIETTWQTRGAAGTGASTAELQKAATFINAGWDFVGERQNGTADIWSIDEGRSYPRFSPAPAVPTKGIWADDFEDGELWPLWQVYEPTPDSVRIREINGRLELHVPNAPGDRGSATCLSSGWALDGSQDFTLKVDYHFTGSDQGEAWVSLGLTPDVTAPVGRRVELTAGCLDTEPVYGGSRADGIGFATWWTARGCDNGTLYLSYDAAGDELYLGFIGYGPANAWHTVTGLLRDRWASEPVYVVLAGGSEGMEIGAGEAWLDNFAVATGTIVE